MNIKINNLGPIKKAKIEIGDITLLLGPPNVGKSYTLKAIYSKLIFMNSVFYEVISKVIISHLDQLLSEVFKNFTSNIQTVVNNEEQEFSFAAPLKFAEIIKDLNRIIKKVISTSIPLQQNTKISINAYKINFDEILNTLLYSTFEEPLKVELKDSKIFPFLPFILKKFFIEVSFEPLKDAINCKFSLKMALEKTNKEKNNVYRKKISEFQKTSMGYDFFIFSPVRVKIKNLISSRIRYNFSEIMKNRYSLSEDSLVFVPFGKTPIAIVNLSQHELFDEIVLLDSSLITNLRSIPFEYKSYWLSFNKGFKNFKNAENTLLLEIFSPVIQGEIIYDKVYNSIRYKKWGIVDVPFQMSSALATEIIGLMIPIMSLKENSIILIEEPESQLHPSAQLLMAITLFAICQKFNHKIIMSTHSDIMAIMFAYLDSLKYSKEDIVALIKKILELQGLTIDDDIEEKISQIGEILESKSQKVKFYAFDLKDSVVTVSEKNSAEIMNNVHKITDTVSILASWAINKDERKS
ncbi:MAG: AAA family ATPase [Candidatus Aenigmatarchaeota archaeon]